MDMEMEVEVDVKVDRGLACFALRSSLFNLHSSIVTLESLSISSSRLAA